MQVSHAAVLHEIPAAWFVRACLAPGAWAPRETLENGQKRPKRLHFKMLPGRLSRACLYHSTAWGFSYLVSPARRRRDVKSPFIGACRVPTCQRLVLPGIDCKGCSGQLVSGPAVHHPLQPSQFVACRPLSLLLLLLPGQPSANTNAPEHSKSDRYGALCIACQSLERGLWRS